MGAKGKQMGEVKAPNGSSYVFFWNQNTGEVHVANESAGYATSSQEAWRIANYYATVHGPKR